MNTEYHRYQNWRAANWARQFLAQPAFILNIKATGLGESDQLIDIAIIDVTGEPVYSSSVRPTIPIPPDPTRDLIDPYRNDGNAALLTHNITASGVTWPEIDEYILIDLLDESPVAVYNEFTTTRLIHQTRVAHGLVKPDEWWNDILTIGKKWHCARSEYARWHGEWDDHHASYRWQPLNGGSKALEDCCATLAKIRKMAAG